MTIPDPDLYAEWRQLVNMTPAALRRFLETPEGKSAGLSRGAARAQGIKSGQESAQWILKMKATSVADWTPTMWAWAKRQVAFIKRMRGARGPLFKEGKPTRKYLSLLVWGHDPWK